MDVLNAKDLSLHEVEQYLNYRDTDIFSEYSEFFPLDALTDFEKQEIQKISSDFQHYLRADRVSEGLVKALTVFPILRLAGFYSRPVELKLEENVVPIVVQERDETVKGRYDILAVNQSAELGQIPFWILVAEAKNSIVAYDAGLPQLLIYAHQSLSHQSSVWGLLTNGKDYQFVLIRKEEVATYQLFSPIHLRNPKAAVQLVQILKALCKLQVPTPLSVAA